MCGIAGYIVNKPLKNYSKVRMAVTLLAIEMESRGKQSWGMMYGQPGGDPQTWRQASSVRDSFSLPETMPQVLALHTRHATTGAIKAGNAHPFTRKGIAGTVVGIHNGMIGNHVQLGRAHNRAYRVDSEHIFAHIADQLPLSQIEGYGAIVYSQDGVWHLGTFNAGELSIAETAIGLFFASTQTSLEMALRLAGIPATKVYSPRDGRLYKLTGSGIQKVGKLNISDDLFGGKWENGLNQNPVKKGTGKEKIISPTIEESEDDYYARHADELQDVGEDYIRFQSDVGEVCEGCGQAQDTSTDMYWMERGNVSLCGNCMYDWTENKREVM